MKDRLDNSLKLIETEAEHLWQGKGANMEKISGALQDVVDVVMNIADELSGEDRTETLSYIENGLNDYKMACDRRDDFLLADCLYYQWREIILIFIGAIEG